MPARLLPLLTLSIQTRMEAPKTTAKGTMAVTVRLLFLFALGASWACDARELMTTSFSSRETFTSDVSVLQINHQGSEGEVKASEEVSRIENVCTLCEEFAAEALKYLKENKTQTEIIGILHVTCSQLVPFVQQCITLVDYYVPILLLELGTVQPEDFCQKINLCGLRVITTRPLAEDTCEICQFAVAEVLTKLKDPDTQLEIIELLLKACDTVESYLKKCKTLVFEYGPLILSNAEQFLETVDICSVFHACDLPSAGSKQASPIEKTSILSVM